MSTSTENSSKKSNKYYNSNFVPAILGIGKLLAVASIVYSTSVIVLGTEGLTPKLMVVPQVAWATVMTVKQFIK